MSPEELAAIRARLDAASPGPWRGDCESGSVRRAVLDATGALVVYGDDHDGDPYYGIHEPEGQNYEPNAALIVNAPTDIAALLAEVERLSAMVPRWVPPVRGSAWRLFAGNARICDASLSAFPGEPVLDTTTGDEYPDLPTACAAVCRRLGLTDIKPPETP